MTEYHQYGVTLSEGQAENIYNAHKKGTDVTIRLTKINLQGEYKLPLTHTQINKIKKAKNGVQLNLSKTQLKQLEQLEQLEKNSGFLLLAALIPLIFSGIGAAGGLAGGISSAVSAVKSNAEQTRHNRAVEEQLKAGSGVVSD